MKTIAKVLRGGKKIEINGRRKVFYPWWEIWSKNEITRMTVDEKSRILFIKNHPSPIGIGAITGSSMPLKATSIVCADLCLTTGPMTEYFSHEFADIWFDYILN